MHFTFQQVIVFGIRKIDSFRTKQKISTLGYLFYLHFVYEILQARMKGVLFLYLCIKNYKSSNMMVIWSSSSF